MFIRQDKSIKIDLVMLQIFYDGKVDEVEEVKLVRPKWSSNKIGKIHQNIDVLDVFDT